MATKSSKAKEGQVAVKKRMGRPPRSEMENDLGVQLTLRLNEKDLNKIDDFISELGMDRSNFIRFAVMNYIKQNSN